MLCLLPFLDWADQATSQFFLQIIHIFPLEPFFLVNISLIHVIRLARAAMKEKFGSVCVEEEKEQDVGRDGGNDNSAQSDLGSLADLYLYGQLSSLGSAVIFC